MEIYGPPAPDQPFNFSGVRDKDLSYLNHLNNPKDYIQPRGELQNLTPKVGLQKMKYLKPVTTEKFSRRQPSMFANIPGSGALDQPANNTKVLGRTERVRGPSIYLKPGSQTERQLRSLSNLKKIVREGSQEIFPPEVSPGLATKTRQKFILTSQVNLNPMLPGHQPKPTFTDKIMKNHDALMLPRFKTQPTLPQKPNAGPTGLFSNSRMLSNRITKYLRKDSQSPDPKTLIEPSSLPPPPPPRPPPQKDPETYKSVNSNHQ